MLNPLVRALPDLLIIGTQRGGTSSLYRYLGAHPSVHASIRKETEFFSSRFALGETWYRAHFPTEVRLTLDRRIGRQPITFEATPDYLLHPLAAERSAQTLPDASLIALLRDPVSRARSHHQHMTRLGFESLSFEEALEAEEERTGRDLARSLEDPEYRPVHYLRFSYRQRGYYAEQLERWLRAYPRERLLVLQSSGLYHDPRGSYQQVVSFLGLPEWSPASFPNYSYREGTPRPTPEPESESLGRLRRHYAPYDQKLTNLLGWKPDWVEASV